MIPAGSIPPTNDKISRQLSKEDTSMGVQNPTASPVALSKR
jgi:hypothetical protein